MSLSTLATVEIQLIMQCLQRDDIARLASCSRSLHHAADAAHVWRFINPIRVPYDAAPLASASLRRHIPVILVWNPAAELKDGISLSDDLLSRVATYPADRVHGVDAWRSNRTIPWEEWARVLSDPRLQQLRFIAMHPPRYNEVGVPASLFLLMSALPLLHTLRCNDIGFETDGQSALRSLPLFPALTSLQIAAYWAPFRTWQLQPVAECRRLRSHRGPWVESPCRNFCCRSRHC